LHLLGIGRGLISWRDASLLWAASSEFMEGALLALESAH